MKMSQTDRRWCPASLVILSVFLVVSCRLQVPGIPGSSQWYIKLNVAAPGGKAISVDEYPVTGLEIVVNDPDHQVLQTISWAAVEGPQSYLIPVTQAGQHEIVVTHISDNNGEPVEATESTLFNIAPMVVTVINITPGAIGMIDINGPSGVPPPELVVYAGGYSINSSDVRVAGYWKNGTWIGLTPLDATRRSTINSLVVSGGDVYAGGENRNSLGVIVPGYWKNGTWIGLTQPDPTKDGWVYSIFVSGSDVYVAGDDFSQAAPGYWKNDTWTGLTPLVAEEGWWWVSNIVVSGTDVYAGGYCRNSSGVGVPGYWKNGTWIGLTPLDPTRDAWIWSLFVSGGDVYASGENYNNLGVCVPGYWKNGTWIGLTPLDLTKDGWVTSLVVSGSDVYAGGGCTNSADVGVPGCWKNGVWTGFAPLDSTKNAGVALLVVVE
jgi:hypothetical protein